MEWKAWSYLALAQREQLPAHPGIYVVVDNQDQVRYVGKSANLNARWKGKGHHRYKQLSRTNSKRVYRIHWKPFSIEQLSEKEDFYIELFKPHLNFTKTKSYLRMAIQPDREISRLLKTINQKTILFPIVRSVLLGYYITLVEDDQEELHENICIVIAISANDHDGAILRSYLKSSKKGSSLKEYWSIYENDCGSSEPGVQPAMIPVFTFEGIVYEFVCYSDLLYKLEQQQTLLHTVEIAQQSVLALRDPKSLKPLLKSDDAFIFRSEAYLHYRVADLQSVAQLLPEVTGS